MKIFRFLMIILAIVTAFIALSQNTLANDCCCLCTDNRESTIADDTEVMNDNIIKCGNFCGANIAISSKRGCGATQAGQCPSANDSPKNSVNEVTLTDPLNLGGDPQELWRRIIAVLLGFVGVASLVSFVYAGFMFLVSAGNPERVKKAKDIMLYAVIGVFISMASYAILSFVFSVLEGSTGNL